MALLAAIALGGFAGTFRSAAIWLFVVLLLVFTWVIGSAISLNFDPVMLVVAIAGYNVGLALGNAVTFSRVQTS